MQNQVLTFQIHFRGQKIEVVKWNPQNKVQATCSFSSNKNIFLFDLEKGDASPAHVFDSPSGSGIFDFIFTSGKSPSKFSK